MTTLAQSGGSSTALTVNTTSWADGVTISTNALGIFALSPIPVDVMFTVSFTIPAGTITDQARVNVWIAISEDGTHYTDNDQYSGTNNSQSSLRSPTNFKGPFVVNTPAASISVVGVMLSLASQLAPSTAPVNAILPRAVGLILENRTGLTLTAPSVTYTAVNYTNS